MTPTTIPAIAPPEIADLSSVLGSSPLSEAAAVPEESEFEVELELGVELEVVPEFPPDRSLSVVAHVFAQSAASVAAPTVISES